MSIDFKSLFEERMSGMQALGKSLNLFLAVEINAKKGNEQLAEMVTYISERVPVRYRTGGDENYFQNFYIGQTFLILVSEFEGFLVDVLRLVVTKHPQKLGSESFKLAEIMAAPNINSLAGLAAERYLNSLTYKRPAEFRRALAELLSADQDFLSANWAKFVEIKARRDLGMHNNWQVNDTYRRKLEEVGLTTTATGYIPPSNEYFWEAGDVLVDLAGDIFEHCQTKFAKS